MPLESVSLKQPAISPSNFSAVRPFRLAAVTAFPIQYNAPFFRALAGRSDVELEVLYASLLGAERARDDELGIDIEWDVPLLDGYNYKVVRTVGKARTANDWRFLSSALIKELTPERFDAALIYGWGSWFDRVAIATCLARKIPYLLTGDSAPIFPEPLVKGAIKHIVIGWVARHAAAILYTGTLQRIYYERFGIPATRLFFHPWGTDNERFIAASESARQRREVIRKEFGIPTEIPIVVFVGKLIARKRPADLLHAMALLQQKGVKCGALLIGEGELRQELEALSDELQLKHVVFAGFVNQRRLPEVLTACDLLVLPSEIEPRGVVINEAMACELPVVISHRSADWGPDDLVEDGQTGFIYFAGDVDALTGKCLLPLLTDSELRLRIGRAARERIRTWGIAERVTGTIEALDHIASARQEKHLRRC